MTLEEQILNEIDRGRAGFNHGITMGMPKLESIMDGNTRETYTLIMDQVRPRLLLIVMYINLC